MLTIEQTSISCFSGAKPAPLHTHIDFNSTGVPAPMQGLALKLLAAGAVAVAVNIPCGMWREHQRKYSPKWFLAIHVTIPLLIAMRKALEVPKWTVLVTIPGAVVGQQVRLIGVPPFQAHTGRECCSR